MEARAQESWLEIRLGIALWYGNFFTELPEQTEDCQRSLVYKIKDTDAVCV